MQRPEFSGICPLTNLSLTNLSVLLARHTGIRMYRNKCLQYIYAYVHYNLI